MWHKKFIAVATDASITTVVSALFPYLNIGRCMWDRWSRCRRSQHQHVMTGEAEQFAAQRDYATAGEAPHLLRIQYLENIQTL